MIPIVKRRLVRRTGVIIGMEPSTPMAVHQTNSALLAERFPGVVIACVPGAVDSVVFEFDAWEECE